LVVGTAIFLARRGIQYDSTLLVGLENLLIFVPFMLVSQAALIDRRIVWEMCLAGAFLALARFAALKHFFPQLNLSNRLLAIGGGLLALNVALPVIYRILGESKLGIKPALGPAYDLNECTWLL